MSLERPELCAARWESLLTIPNLPPGSCCYSSSLGRPASEGGRKGGTALTSQMPPTTASPPELSAPPGLRGRGDGGWEGRAAPRSHSPRFDSLYEHDLPIRNQGLISQLTASSSIISIQTN